MNTHHPSRRGVLIGGALAVTGAAFAGGSVLAQAPLAPTPACEPGGAATLPQTAGPFFKPSSPERTSLIEPGVLGREFVLAGFVLTRGCKPVPGALLDFWQADGAGAYDNRGFRLRGHQFADAEGRYSLRTVMPAEYATRTPHIHVRVQAPSRPALTTQLYFPDQPRNARDFLYRPELLMRIAPAAGDPQGRFDFVLDMA
jgi:protocatechuate 3,4-dioxygenase beta subunit